MRRNALLVFFQPTQGLEIRKKKKTWIPFLVGGVFSKPGVTGRAKAAANKAN